MNNLNQRIYSFMRVFGGMMSFCILVWMWTVAFIIGWPYTKTDAWQPQFRLVAVCAEQRPCGINHGELTAAKASGNTQLLKPESDGELMDGDKLLRWSLRENGVIQTRVSNWSMQNTVRYRIEGEGANASPVLLEYQEVGANQLYYALAAAAFTLIGLYLRKLRK
jgi:hypothetical protein